MEKPGVQTVPAATDWTADQVPLAHCWKEVPLMQLKSPAVVQAVPGVMADDDPVPVGAAADAVAATDVAGTKVTVTEAGNVVEAARVEAATGMVTKTPPADVKVVAVPMATVEVAAAAEVEAAAVVPPVATTLAAHPAPVGAARAEEAVDPPRSTRESPGLGNTRSLLS